MVMILHAAVRRHKGHVAVRAAELRETLIALNRSDAERIEVESE